MFINPFVMIAIIVPVSCLLVAAWPLLFLARFRPAVSGALGSGCMGIGAAVVALLAGGLVPLPTATAVLRAEDQPAEVAATPKLAEALPEAEPGIESPGDTIEIPPGRPAWIGSEPNTSGKTHTIAVSSGPYALDKQSRLALDEALVKATHDYIADQLGSDYAPHVIRYDARTIRKRFLKPEHTYHDVARYSVGWMHENFALLEFDPKFRNELDRRWTQVKATSRLAQTGLISGAAIFLLASVFGYFRLDNATRGYYTGRLQFMTAAAILAVVGAGAVLARWIHWL